MKYIFSKKTKLLSLSSKNGARGQEIASSIADLILAEATAKGMAEYCVNRIMAVASKGSLVCQSLLSNENGVGEPFKFI